MKKTSTLFALTMVVLLAAATVGCKQNPSEELRTVNFEQAQLDENGLLLADYTREGAIFTHNAAEGYWHGFAVSNNKDVTTAGIANQYSAFDANSSKFGIVYYSAYDNVFPTFNFGPYGTEYRMSSAEFVNSTYTALAIRDGSAFSKQFEAGDWFKTIAKGYDRNGTPTGSVDIYLADFRDGKNYIMDRWTRVDLSALGMVNRVEFDFASTDNGESGMNTPSYFCIDNIEFVFEGPFE